MTINANTKIASVLKHAPGALEAIISISPKFEKLRNPFLRKLMAGRTSLSMASKIGGCSINDFFAKLKPFGFEVDAAASPVIEEKKQLPEFISSIDTKKISKLDVRPIIENGKDPLSIIIEKTKGIKKGEVLKIINSFEPTPLMLLLKKQGFESYADVIDENLVETYFYKKDNTASAVTIPNPKDENGWDDIMQRFKDKMQTVDVRALEMPMPMLTILDALDKLPADTALFVYHKRIPVFLLPELTQRKFEFRIKEISDSEVHLLIFKL
jgi:uncharacterized protein (DUF2249 family)